MEANQAANRQKGGPGSLLWFSLCAGMLPAWVSKQHQAKPALGAAESHSCGHLLDVPCALRGVTKGLPQWLGSQLLSIAFQGECINQSQK